MEPYLRTHIGLLGRRNIDMKKIRLSDKLTIHTGLALGFILLAATAYAMEIKKLSLDDVRLLKEPL